MTRPIRTLIIDNTIDQPWQMGRPFLRYLGGYAQVRRAPQMDLPSSPESFSHIILSGSKTSCLDTSEWVEQLIRFLETAVQKQIPVLGVCFGHQILARLFSGTNAVGPSTKPELGWVSIQKKASSKAYGLLQDLPESFYSYQSHFEEVRYLPPEFDILAQSDRCGIQAFAHKSKPVFGIQFHPEKTLEEARRAIESEIKTKPKPLIKDCLFNPPHANSLYNENVAIKIFRNFANSKT